MTEPRNDISNGNQLYWQMRQFWTDCLNLKEPLPQTLASYLNRYLKEDDTEFAQRVKRIAQVNFVDLIVDAYCSMLFSTDVRVTSTKYDDKVQSFVNRCNQQGDSLKEYFREMIAPAAFTYGIVDVFCDLPSVSGQEVNTVAQAKAAGLDSPYCFIVPCLNRTAWSLNDAREYTMYRSQDVINTQIAGQFALNDEKQYSEWTLDTVSVYDNKGVPIKERTNPFGFIPAVTVAPLPSMRFYGDRMGLSLVQDVVPLQKLILNLISLIFDFHESVNFGMRILKWAPDDQSSPPTEGELAEGGNKRGLTLQGQHSDYKIVTPDAAGVEAMCRFLQEMIERAFQSVRIPSDANSNKTHQSTGSIRGNMAPLYNRMVRISKHFEKSMRLVIETALRIQGIDPAEAGVKVAWGNNFAFESFITAIQELTALKEVIVDIAPTAVAEIARKTVGAQIYDTEKSADVEKEIDAWVKRQNAMNAAPPIQPGAKGKPGQQGDATALPSLQKQNTEMNAANKIAVNSGTDL